MIINKKTIVQYMAIYLLLIMHGAVVWSTRYEAHFLPLLCIMGVTILFTLSYGAGFPDSKLILLMIVYGFFFMMSGCIYSQSIMHGLNIKSLLMTYESALLANFAYRIDRHKAATRCVKMITFFVAISLVLYFYGLCGGVDTLKNTFPMYHAASGTRVYYGKYVYSILSSKYEADGYTRNIGIFYEPGVYQIVLNAAIYILLYCEECVDIEPKKRIRYLVVLIIAVLSTRSTTGYLGMGILFLGILFKRRNRETQRVACMILLVTAVLLCDYLANGDKSILQVYVLGKLEGITTGESYYSKSSGGARMIMFSICLGALVQNPVFGIGTESVETQVEALFGNKSGTGNALCGDIAKKGLVTTSILLYSLFHKIWVNRRDRGAFFIFVAMYINATFAQSQICYGLFWFIAFLEKRDFEHQKMSAITTGDMI